VINFFSCLLAFSSKTRCWGSALFWTGSLVS
jgi:hypothetical protein